jgi:hypothetical protein
VARGTGFSGINGHPDSWLDGVSLENVKLFIAHDPSSPLEKTEQAIKVRWAKNLKMKDVEVVWDKPESTKWRNALSVEDVKQFELDGFTGRQAKLGTDDAAVILNRVEGATVRNSRAAEGTSTFLQIKGGSRRIHLVGNDFQEAKVPYTSESDVRREEIKAVNNFPAKE